MNSDRLARARYTPAVDYTFWCSPTHHPLQKCIWCDAHLMELGDFYYFVTEMQFDARSS